MTQEASSDFEDVIAEFPRRQWSKISGEVWKTINKVKEEAAVQLHKVLEALPHLTERVIRACINQFVKAKALVPVKDGLFQLVS